MRKRVATGALVIAIMPVLLVVAYYCIVFLPNQIKPRESLASAADSCGPVAGRLSKLLLTYGGQREIDLMVAPATIRDAGLDFINPGGIHLGMLGWHLNAALWSRLIRFAYSEDERLSLWCHYYHGIGPKQERLNGLRAMAMGRFGRPPEQVSDIELAMLVIAMRNPGSAWRDPKRLSQFAEKLIEKVANEI